MGASSSPRVYPMAVFGGSESTENDSVRVIPAGLKMCSRTYV